MFNRHTFFPNVSSITPDVAAVAGGSNITVTGANMRAGLRAFVGAAAVPLLVTPLTELGNSTSASLVVVAVREAAQQEPPPIAGTRALLSTPVTAQSVMLTLPAWNETRCVNFVSVCLRAMLRSFVVCVLLFSVYERITLQNADGGYRVLDRAVYYAESCLTPGFYAQGSACLPCPAGSFLCTLLFAWSILPVLRVECCCYNDERLTSL
jgi:hypothetical protein